MSSHHEQNLPKKHHYIPQFYLKKFSNDGEHLFVLDKLAEQQNRFRYQSITSIAFEKHLYAYKIKNGNNETLEDMFAQIEGRAATIIEKIENKQDITSQDKNDFSLFLSFLWIRTPYSKNKFKLSTQELYEKTARKMIAMTPKENIKEFLINKGKILTDKEIDDLVDFGINEKRSKVSVSVPQNYWIKQMLRLGFKISPALEIADWEFRIAKNAFAFITSDNPFLLIPSQLIQPFEELGLLTPGAKKIIPITSKICLVIHEPKRNPQIFYAEIDKPFFRKINDWIVKYSDRFVFSADKGKVNKIIKINKNFLKPVSKGFSVS